MERINNVGDVFVPVNGVHWIIPNFYSLPQKRNTIIASPHFSFADGDWTMCIYPNGCSWDTAGWFGIEVQTANVSLDSTSYIVRLGVAGLQENILSSRTEINDLGAHCCHKLIRRSILESQKSNLVPKGNLHVFFLLQNRNDDSAEVTLHGKRRKQKSENSRIDAATQTEKEMGVGKLKEDFKDILLNGDVSDVVLKVEGQEFKCHRSILAARSPVFLAMMMHDTKEKATGVVDIQDVDPNTFPDFLNYLYTGSVESVTSENAHKLYATSDIYQVNDLKDICLDHMLNNISTENFCDVFTLSLRHDEKDLKEACIQFFAENSLDIVVTSKWQTFLCENPITGNELFIKHLKLKR